MAKLKHLVTGLLVTTSTLIGAPSFGQNTQKILQTTQNQLLQDLPSDIDSYPIDWIVRHYKESAESIIRENLLHKTNAIRKVNSLKILQSSSYLDSIAHLHAVELFERYGTNNPKNLNDYHLRNDGGDPTSDANKGQIKYNFVVENVGFNCYSIDDAMTHWIQSPGHFANILDTEAEQMGVSYYKGYWVILLGKEII